MSLVKKNSHILNSLHISIKSTWEISDLSVNFLDLSIFLTDGIIKYRLFRKCLKKYLYIPYKSAQSANMKRSFNALYIQNY